MPDGTEDTVASAPDGADLLEGRYRLGARIGGGGMGDVYRATDTRLSREVAVKVLRDAPASDARRFSDEVQLLARCAHPHLVRVLDAGEADGRAFLVMELVEGATLAARLGDGAMAPEEVASIAGSIAAALAYVHGQGIVHRDVKPANILVAADGWAWLADFGIARLVDSTRVTTTGLALGTPAYLAPEQVDGGVIGPAADVYALGLVTLEALTGTRAFDGTPAEMMSARLQRAPEIPEQLDASWRLLLRSMTALSPGDRLPAGDVASILAGRGGIGTPLSTGSGSPVVGPAMLDLSAQLVTEAWPPTLGDTASADGPTVALAGGSAPPSRRSGGRRLRLGAGALAAVGCGVLVGVLLLGGDAKGPGAGANRPPAAGKSSAKSSTGATSSSTTTSPPTTTSTSTSTTTSTTTTTTTVPLTSATSSTRAAGVLASAIDAGVAGGTIDSQAGQQLEGFVAPFLVPATGQAAQQTAQQLQQLVNAFNQDVAHGQITGSATETAVSGAITDLATSLGASVTSVTSTTPTAPSPPDHGHGGHHGQ